MRFALSKMGGGKCSVLVVVIFLYTMYSMLLWHIAAAAAFL